MLYSVQQENATCSCIAMNHLRLFSHYMTTVKWYRVGNIMQQLTSFGYCSEEFFSWTEYSLIIMHQIYKLALKCLRTIFHETPSYYIHQPNQCD